MREISLWKRQAQYILCGRVSFSQSYSRWLPKSLHISKKRTQMVNWKQIISQLEQEGSRVWAYWNSPLQKVHILALSCLNHTHSVLPQCFSQPLAHVRSFQMHNSRVRSLILNSRIAKRTVRPRTARNLRSQKLWNNFLVTFEKSLTFLLLAALCSTDYEWLHNSLTLCPPCKTFYQKILCSADRFRSLYFNLISCLVLMPSDAFLTTADHFFDANTMIAHSAASTAFTHMFDSKEE